MALKQDERALLQLVCERGQSYDDLAELLGISTDEVKSKARGALTELGGSDPDAEVGLTDYLLGQADPIGRADAVRFLQQDPGARELAETISTKLLAIAPDARLPTIPEAKGKRRRPPAAAVTEAETPPKRSRDADEPAPGTPVAARPSLSRQQSRMLVGIVAGAFVLIAIVVGVVLAGGDDSGDLSDDQAAAQEQRTITPVELSPRGNSGVGGTANFGTANTTLFVDLEVSGLDPGLGEGRAYLMWMMVNNNLGLPLPVPVVPNQNGVFRDQIPIAQELLGIAAAASTVRIAETPTSKLGTAIQAAADQGSPVVAFEGKNLADGEIPPDVGAEVAVDAGAVEGASEGEAAGDDTGAGEATAP